jgi:predicted ribosome quality control (RQC) complex YloA/Tae2 family protein
VVVDIDLNISA